MKIRNIAQNFFRTIYLSMALGFISNSSADQSMFVESNDRAPFLNDVSSIDHYQAPAYQTDNQKTVFTFKQRKEINEERIGSFIYKTIDNPNKVRDRLAGSAILYGLDSIGLGESVKEGIYFIKKNTRFSFSDCGEVQLRTNRITAGSCLPDGGSVELNSNYNFNSVRLEFKWSL